MRKFIYNFETLKICLNYENLKMAIKKKTYTIN